jgi:acyl-CoA synthetase (NDP forming)
MEPEKSCCLFFNTDIYQGRSGAIFLNLFQTRPMPMLARELIHPQSIAVIGGSNSLHKPGGKVLQNLLKGNFAGELYVVNPKEDTVQGVKSYPDAASLPQTDLAILAVAARFCPDTLDILVREKGTRGFIILSAGFGEESEEGRAMEKHMAGMVESVGGSLIGPNCIGVINRQYRGVFTSPVPQLDPQGCDFISGSGATAVFIMEAGIPNGLTFSSVWSVGNSAQTGVEDVLRHLDETFDPATSSRVILLYIETIEQPGLILKHASSLVRKGCHIAAIKSGTTEAGSRAASSHTGALASPDTAVEALFRKAGIIRCHSREELVAVASVFRHRKPEGKRMAIITHAGGPAVMLTDVLTEGGMEVPPIVHPKAQELLRQLSPGSSVSNPIDILATGTAEQLAMAIDYCERYFNEIDGMIVIFGTPGLFSVSDVYRTLHEKMNTCRKPIFPVLPSVVNAREEIAEFLSLGRINFPDEVRLGKALVKVVNAPGLQPDAKETSLVEDNWLRELVADSLAEMSAGETGSGQQGAGHGYLSPSRVQDLLDAAGIIRVLEKVVRTKVDAVLKAEQMGFPVVMKVVGPIHKSDAGGVALNIGTPARASEEFERIMRIPGAEAVMVQPMVGGLELFAGVKREGKYGHLILCGMGGIFVEVLGDVKAELAPLTRAEAMQMIHGLKGYSLIQGVRGREGVDEEAFADILLRLSQLVQAVPEIAELDLNPLFGMKDRIIAVDARIRLDPPGPG